MIFKEGVWILICYERKKIGRILNLKEANKLRKELLLYRPLTFFGFRRKLTANDLAEKLLKTNIVSSIEDGIKLVPKIVGSHAHTKNYPHTYLVINEEDDCYKLYQGLEAGCLD